MNYIALIYKDENSDYGVMFPDFPGCVTAASTLDEAKSEAKEALSGHIEVMKEDNELLPVPTSLDDIMKEREYRDAVAFLVEIPTSRVVRVNVTFTQEMLDLIDRRARQFHLTRSAFLAKAAEDLHEEKISRT